MPTPGRLSISRCASSKTGTGKTAGPALKLKILSVMPFLRYLLSHKEAQKLLVPFVACYSKRERSAFAATFVTTDLGTTRSASTTNQLAQPEITTFLPRASP